jgi:hypothetical protein
MAELFGADVAREPAEGEINLAGVRGHRSCTGQRAEGESGGAGVEEQGGLERPSVEVVLGVDAGQERFSLHAGDRGDP